MDPPVSSDRLAAISDNVWFVLGAYLVAFYPWVGDLDYISGKWRTVKRTRILAWRHVVLSIWPMMYVALYGESQRRAGDTKELGAAVAALILHLYQFIRTVWGLAQLNAFVAWCKEAMKCLRAMKGDEEDGASTSSNNESGGFSSNDDDEISLEEKLMVNNSVVDNELGETDVVVELSLHKAWAGVKRWEFKPSAWLTTDYAGLCTARWTATFLCGMANVWCAQALLGCSRVGEGLTSFFSGDMDSALHFLRDVTCSVEESDKSTIVSLTENDYAESGGAAYGSDGLHYVFGRYKSYTVENDGLRSSYPPISENREMAVAGLADSVELAKHLGVEKLTAMRRYFDRYRLATNEIWKKAWYLLLEQGDCAPPDYSPLSDMFEVLEGIPFPYQLQMVALWDECTNWRVLQASAQADISSSLYYEDRENRNLVEMEPRTTNVFEHCRREAFSGESIRTGIIGVSMESVRTFLAEWLISTAGGVDWEPQISGEQFKFFVSSYLIQRQRCGSAEHNRMIWECQLALQSKLSKTSTAHCNFASNTELMMLFILSIPSLRVEEEEEKLEVFNDDNSVSRLESAHSTVNMSVGVWCAYSTVEPQDVKVIIRIDSESRKASLSLQCGAPDTRFKWEDWMNTAMGMMKGYDEAIAKIRGIEGETKRWLRKVELGEPVVVELCPLYWDENDSVVETGTVRIWMGWRVFDARICKFEMEQWLRACNIDLKNIDGRSVEEKEVWRAEEVIRQVVKAGEYDVDGEA